MRTVFLPSPHPPPAPPVALAIGNFDGVHLGHQAVLGSAVEQARALGGEAWVLTFDPHPARVLRPDRAPALLTTDAQRGRLLAGAGVGTWWHMPFTPEVAALAPAAFLDRLRAALPGLRAIRVGENWRFGRGAAGDVAMLTELASAHGIGVRGLPPVCLHGGRVSSTRIREAIAAGAMESAAEFLGRPYALTGAVVRGRGFARQLGFPSANVAVEQEVFPADGIYACRVRLGEATFAGAGYVPRGGNAFEVHLLGFAGDAYGRPLEAEILHRLRPDRPIGDLDELRRAIASDVAEVERRVPLTPR